MSSDALHRLPPGFYLHARACWIGTLGERALERSISVSAECRSSAADRPYCKRRERASDHTLATCKYIVDRTSGMHGFGELETRCGAPPCPAGMFCAGPVRSQRGYRGHLRVDKEGPSSLTSLIREFMPFWSILGKLATCKSIR